MIMNKRKGATLVEMILVVALIAILSVTLTPFIRTLRMTWESSTRRTEMVQSGRASLDRITKDFRKAALITEIEEVDSDPCDYIKFSVKESADTTREYAFFHNIDNNPADYYVGTVGNIKPGDVVMASYPTEEELQAEPSLQPTYSLLARSVESLTFTYLDEEGQAAESADGVSSVQMAMAISDPSGKAPLKLTATSYLRTGGGGGVGFNPQSIGLMLTAEGGYKSACLNAEDIQTTMNEAEAGGHLLLRAGTYQVNLRMIENVSLWGGYEQGFRAVFDAIEAEGSYIPGPPDTDNARDLSANTTILDGNNSDSVIKANDMRTSITIDGFTVQNGIGIKFRNNYYGGGIYCQNASPTISNNIISGNRVGNNGGGIFCESSSPTILNNTISGNNASDGGGGIYCNNNSSPTISNNTISGNNASDGGGGIYCNYSSPIITNCVISQNQAEKGAGIYCLEESSPQIIHSAILDNKGEALYCDSNCHPKLINTISWGNDERPGVVLAGASRITVNHCLLEGGRENFSSREVNCVLHWYGPEESPHPQLRESDILPGLYHLTANSPCIDAGVYVGVTTDIDGETRGLYDSKLDIGPDERIDRDGDGWPARADCDDSNPDVNPDAEEDRGNGIDDDCDGQTDEGCFISVVTFFQ